MRALGAPEADAYGSVCIFPSGHTPVLLYQELDGKTIWQRYLLAGGRIVNITDPPFYVFQSTDGLPAEQPQGTYERLGLRVGWNSPYWGQDLAITPTDQGKAWGFESLGATKTGFAVEEVSVVFGQYAVPELPGRFGAAAWLKNSRPDMPWSGLVQVIQYPDGNNDSHVRDTWRAAHYAGSPVECPPMPPPLAPPGVPPVTLVVSASGIAGREELARGEPAEVTVRLEDGVNGELVELALEHEGAPLGRWMADVVATGAVREARFTLETDGMAYGLYTLRATTRGGSGPAVTTELPLGVRHVPPEDFAWGIWINDSRIRARRDMIVEAQAKLGMEPHVVEMAPTLMDAHLRQNIGFSAKITDECQVVPPGTNTSA